MNSQLTTQKVQSLIEIYTDIYENLQIQYEKRMRCSSTQALESSILDIETMILAIDAELSNLNTSKIDELKLLVSDMSKLVECMKTNMDKNSHL